MPSPKPMPPAGGAETIAGMPSWSTRRGQLRGKMGWRHTIIAAMAVLLLAAPARGDSGESARALGCSILDVKLVEGRLLRVEIATAGLQQRDTDQPDVALDAWLGDVRAHGSLLLTPLPPRFAMDIDFAGGAVKVGAVKVGEFVPVRPFTENVRFPVQVTVRDGSRVATASRMVTLLLPTVIVPGVGNELNRRPEETLAPYIQHGYHGGGGTVPLFWFGYTSHEVDLPEAGQQLAKYVRQVVLRQTYAGKINVIGYSLGGLIARWDAQFDVDGWGTLINRLILIGVPNEGSVLAYMYRNLPGFVPYAYFARAPAARVLMPTFPFWRAAPADPWSVPQDGANPTLAQLNARPLPQGIRVWTFFGARGGDAANTLAGLTESANSPEFAAGDGVVLADSAQGLPIHGGTGVAALRSLGVVRVDLGPVAHGDLLVAAADRIVPVLLNRFVETSGPPAQRQPTAPAEPGHDHDNR